MVGCRKDITFFIEIIFNVMSNLLMDIDGPQKSLVTEGLPAEHDYQGSGEAVHFLTQGRRPPPLCGLVDDSIFFSENHHAAQNPHLC